MASTRNLKRNRLNEIMDHNSETLALVRQAGTGNRDSMEKLLEATRPRLFAYLMRLTMDYNLVEDLLQEVQTDILTSLWRLNKPGSFWPWIYKHAWGKVQHHYRDTRKHETLFLSDIEKDFIDHQLSTVQTVQLDNDTSCNEETHAGELFETIYDAMKQIGLKPRNVLTMRCFDEMSFQEIAELLDCTETNARVMFFRAKHKLKNRLRRKGYRPATMFLPALGLFGTVTSKTASAGTTAATVSSASLEVGFGPSMIGFLTTKAGLALSATFSAIVTWFTVTNLFLIALITLLLTPVFLGLALYVAYDSR